MSFQVECTYLEVTNEDRVEITLAADVVRLKLLERSPHQARQKQGWVLHDKVIV
jgi:hypothetical protein